MLAPECVDVWIGAAQIVQQQQLCVALSLNGGCLRREIHLFERRQMNEKARKLNEEEKKNKQTNRTNSNREITLECIIKKRVKNYTA